MELLEKISNTKNIINKYGRFYVIGYHFKWQILNNILTNSEFLIYTDITGGLVFSYKPNDNIIRRYGLLFPNEMHNKIRCYSLFDAEKYIKSNIQCFNLQIDQKHLVDTSALTIIKSINDIK